MSSFVYNAAKLSLLQGGLDLAGDDLKVALVTADYAADADAHEFFADVSAEASGSGYAAGGKPLPGAALTRDDANDQAVFSADGLIWPVATFIVRGAVLYKDSGDPASSPLLAYIDFEEELEISGEDFLLQWHQNGILTLGD
ncbi:MAG: hypothetical protein KIS85_08435 [Anaerolineales bacterium]|nr:hypothetical protein [Anaerolineales bacterium]